MAEKGVDYSAVLADLRARKLALEKAIQGIELLIVSGAQGSSISQGASEGGQDASPPDQGVPASVEPDTFFKMTIADAAKKFLRIVKKKQATRAIAEALEKGGITHSSENFTNTVAAILRREWKKDGGIVNVHGNWGLVEWYPGLNRKRGGGEAGEAGG
jgi:hypothetical protein